VKSGPLTRRIFHPQSPDKNRESASLVMFAMRVHA
jgi:hypothetical protein